jgi:GNAT superfamily N-acetyltransferase
MLTTEFLSNKQFSEYAAWLKAQDSETLHNYFGCAIDSVSIDALVAKFAKNPTHNHFLVAKIDGEWAGTIHIASHAKAVEFGVIVAPPFRKQGIANTMMDEAITWARNRFYTDLYMHCIGWNLPIKHLCRKYGLLPRNMLGDSEANLQLEAPNPISFFKEQMTAQRNILALLQPPKWSH